MKLLITLAAILLCNCLAYSQSGRRGQTITVPVPPPEVVEPKSTAQPPSTTPVAAQKNEDYRCTDDGSLARILESEDEEKVDTSKKPDTPVQILSKPPPGYTRQARQLGVQGQVILKVLLSSEGQVARIRVHRSLPAGLTENAIRAACKIKFKPAINAGEAVSRWVTLEYAFRLSQSSIFGP